MRAVAAIKSPANSPGRKSPPAKSRYAAASPSPGASAAATAGFNASPLVDSLIAERMITHNPFFAEQDKSGSLGRLRRNASQTRKLKNFTNLQMSDLLLLKNAFDEADVDGSGALSPDEFVATFSKVTDNNDSTLLRLFMRIDANCDGTVSWDEFISFMLCQDQGASIIAEESGRAQFQLPVQVESAMRCVGHEESIVRVLVLDGATDSWTNDGSSFLWHPNTDPIKPPVQLQFELPFVTDVARVEAVRLGDKLVASCADRTLTFFDLSFERLKLEGKCSVQSAPMTMLVYANHKNVKFMAVGDDGGGVVVYNLEELQKLSINNLVAAVPKAARAAAVCEFKPHTDWVTRLVYVDGQGLFSCSSDGTVVLSEVLKGEKKWFVKAHKKGVNDIVWCHSQQWLASCGLGRVILLWQISISTPVFTLEGHQASVQSLCMHEDTNTLISLDSDRVLNIWDTRTLRCVQHINAEHQHPEWPVSACAYDSNRRVLVTAAKKVLVWPQKARTVASGHESAISAALFNPLFNLVVSGDEESLVTLWDLETGNAMFRFKNAHGLQKITAMAFDKTARRLITAGHMDPDGAVKVWNFSTGEVLLTLQAPPQDLTNVVHLDIGNAQYFVGVGWGRNVIIWPDILVSNNETVPIKKVMTGHKEDILCMDFMLPNCLATGSYDGEILLWNLDSQTLRTQNFRLLRPEIDSIPHPRRGVETLKFVTCKNRHNFILSTGGDMKIHVWNIERGTRASCTVPTHAGADAISCLEINVQQQLMFTADNAGCAQTWDIAGFIDHREHDPKPSHFAVAHSFRCHAIAITSLQYIGSRMLLVTGSMDFTVAAWSITGAPAGVFGRPEIWRGDLIAERAFAVGFKRNTGGDQRALSAHGSHARVDAFLTQALDDDSEREEAEVEVGSDMWDALRTSSPVELREAAVRVRPKLLKEQLNEQFDMEKGVEKILLERQVAKDRGTLGAVNVAVWHRSVVHEPKKDLEQRLPDRVARKYISKKGLERSGITQHMMQNMNAEARAEAPRGARGGDEGPSPENATKAVRAIEKIFQA